MFYIVECKACRLIRLDPRPSPEEMRNYYPEMYWYAPDHTFASRMEQIYRRFVVRDHVNFVAHAIRESGESGLVLDVGCGTGLFLSLLRENLQSVQGWPTVGLDTSRQAAALAWQSNKVPVILGDLAKSPILNDSCAAVTMFHVVEHLYDPVAYLQSARALLRRNGRLIVQVPNASSWQFMLFGEYWNGVDIPRHLINYRQTDIESLLDYTGFEVLRRKHFSLRDNTAGFASSIAPGLDPVARRVRGTPESGETKAIKDLVYFGVVLGALPFTLCEAACGAGSTIMLDARRKP
jgi:SAM-dependent methyltransferase